MASGDTIAKFMPAQNEPPATAYATWGLRNNHPVLNFDDTTSESAVFTDVLSRNYSGGGLTVYIHYSAAATTGDVDWDVAFERIGDQQQDVDADGFAAAQSVIDTVVPATSGLVDIVNIAFTNGAQIDSIAVGEKYRIKVTRNTADTAIGDIELHAIEIKET